MQLRKLLIADSVEEFRLALAGQLRDTYRIRLCQDGPETLEMILAFKPDFVVLDMMLPGLDGITILQEAARHGVQPVVLATTKYPTDYMIWAASRLNVAYMMVKPCPIKATVARLQDLEEQLQPHTVSRPEPRVEISNILMSLGISTKLRGYAYLREAILEAVSRPGQSVTKELYPAVGKICGATQLQVERSIRSAIHKAWERRDDALWRRYFQTPPSEQLQRPSNAVFISCIADRINMDISNGNSDLLYNLREEQQ